MSNRTAASAPDRSGERAGPRPLPLHLLTHASTLMGSRLALPLLSSGSLPWKPHLAARAEEIRRSLAGAGADAAEAFSSALDAEAASRHAAFLDGIQAYRHHPYHRHMEPMPVLWREGTSRLLDYRAPGAASGVPVLVVPSLINRAYILDLSERRSLLRYLAAKGMRPFLLDWDAPGAEEREFTLTDYVAGRLGRALERVAEETGERPALVGYCMGGMLALACALLRPEQVRSVTLIATPWDFAAGRESHAAMMRALKEPLGALIKSAGHVPVDLLQAMFSGGDPNLVARKFQAFARLARRSAKARDFVALEDWANDGVPLAGPVALECLFGWYGANDPAEGRWAVAGTPVRPELTSVPTLLVVPEKDRIVPPASAMALARLIPGAKVMTVKGGHVGMLTGPRAKTDVYAPLAKWVVRSSIQ
jgi:polyhydroxyalkanoate synthase